MVGFTNLFIDILIYWLLTRIAHWQYLLAAVCSFTVAVSWSFFINRRWTFRHQEPDLHLQYAKFFMANCVSLVFNLSLLYFFVDFCGLHDLLAKLVTAFFVAFLNFALNRFWTFKAVILKAD